jgi:hypothetical protein
VPELVDCGGNGERGKPWEAKLRTRLACDSSAGELLVEHPDADSIAALDSSTLPPAQRCLPRFASLSICGGASPSTRPRPPLASTDPQVDQVVGSLPQKVSLPDTRIPLRDHEPMGRYAVRFDRIGTQGLRCSPTSPQGMCRLSSASR